MKIGALAVLWHNHHHHHHDYHPHHHLCRHHHHQHHYHLTILCLWRSDPLATRSLMFFGTIPSFLSSNPCIRSWWAPWGAETFWVKKCSNINFHEHQLLVVLAIKKCSHLYVVTIVVIMSTMVCFLLRVRACLKSWSIETELLRSIEIYWDWTEIGNIRRKCFCQLWFLSGMLKYQFPQTYDKLRLNSDPKHVSMDEKFLPPARLIMDRFLKLNIWSDWWGQEMFNHQFP